MANLIENALIHTPPGTPVTVSVRGDDGAAVLEVADRGPGIPAEAMRQRIFERFARGGGDRAGGGSGLGLAIVRAVAEAHGGRVEVLDAPGGGARFVVTLPLGGEHPRRGGRATHRRRPGLVHDRRRLPGVSEAEPEIRSPVPLKHLSRLRPSPALVVALIALFVSLGGVSYGVATGYIDSREIRNNTVASGDIRNNDIRTKDLRNNEVRGIDIRNSTVQGRDIALATVTGQDVKESTLSEVPTAARATRAGTSGSVGFAACDHDQGRGPGRRARDAGPVRAPHRHRGLPGGHGRPAGRGTSAVQRGRLERGWRGGVLRGPRSRRSDRGRGGLHRTAGNRVLSASSRPDQPPRSAAWCR